jgi:hypothetical protein
MAQPPNFILPGSAAEATLPKTSSRMSFLNFVKDMLSVVPALAVAFAAIGFVFVEVYLITRYGVHVINIDIRYLLIASAIGLLVFAVTATITFIIIFLFVGPIASVPALLIGIVLGVVVGVPLATPPTDVVLIFKEPIAGSGLPLAADTANPKRSQTVTKLIDLTDGILVQDRQSRTVISIKNDMLNGIVEFVPPVAAPSIAPTPTPATTPTRASITASPPATP